MRTRSCGRRDVRLPGNVVIGGGRSGRWHRLGGKLVVAENNDYRLNAGGRREFAPDSPLRKTDSNSRSLREGKAYKEPLHASIAVSGLNL